MIEVDIQPYRSSCGQVVDEEKKRERRNERGGPNEPASLKACHLMAQWGEHLSYRATPPLLALSGENECG